MVEKVEPEKQAGHDGDSDRPDIAEKSVKGTVLPDQSGGGVALGRKPVLIDDDDVTVTGGNANIAAMVAATVDGPVQMGGDEDSPGGKAREISNGAVMVMKLRTGTEDPAGSLLAIDVRGKKMLEHIMPVVGFFDNRVLDHAEAGRIICELLPDLDVSVLDEKLEEVKGRINPWSLHESVLPVDEDIHWEDGDARAKMREAFMVLFRTSEPVLYHNSAHLGSEGFVDLALRCPRVYPEDVDIGGEFGVRVDKGQEALQAVLYQLLFCLMSHRVMSTDEDYRAQYYLGAIAASLAHKAGVKSIIPPGNVERATPSLALSDRFSLPELRRLIDARLSLLFPDKGGQEPCVGLLQYDSMGGAILARVVQEDFVTCDLIALTRLAGIYEEYSGFFDALMEYRRVLFTGSLHLDKGASGNRLCIPNVVSQYGKEHNERPPHVVSIGCGNGLTEKAILGMGLANSVHGIDKDHGLSNDEGEVFASGRGQISILGASDIDFDQPGASRLMLRRVVSNVLAGGGKAGVLMFADALHETDDPRAYFITACRELLDPGGLIYVTDPIHSWLVDGLTAPALVPFDSTRHPSSFLSLEEYGLLFLYLRMKGYRVSPLKIVPGAFAGYADILWRLKAVLRKPLIDEPLPYQIPDGEAVLGGQFMTEARDVLKIFPLSLIADSGQQEQVLHKVSNGPYKDGVSAGMHLFSSVRKIVLASKVLPKGVDPSAYLSECMPYRLLSELLSAIGVRRDRELKRRNAAAAEVIAIARSLKSSLGIDMAPALRQQPGWEGFL